MGGSGRAISCYNNKERVIRLEISLGEVPELCQCKGRA